MFRNVQRQIYIVYDWFVDLYNESMGTRIVMQQSLQISNMWDAGKIVINNLKDAFGSLGDIIKGIFTLDTDLTTKSFKNVGKSAKTSKEIV